MSKNTIHLEGRAMYDADVRGKVASVKIAVESWRKKKNAAPDEKYPNESNFFTVVGFGANAEAVGRARKGQIVVCDGSCEIVSWTSANTGKSGTTVEVHVGGKDGSFEALDWQEYRDRQKGGDGGSSAGSKRVPASGGRGPLPRGDEDEPAAGGAEFFDDSEVPF